MPTTPTASSPASAAVAAEVRGLMAKHRVNQAEMGSWIGASQSGVARRLNGRVAFTVDELAILAGRFGVSVASLLGDVA